MTKPNHSGIYPRTSAASVVCACGVTVPQEFCNELEKENVALQARLEEITKERDRFLSELGDTHYYWDKP